MNIAIKYTEMDGVYNADSVLSDLDLPGKQESLLSADLHTLSDPLIDEEGTLWDDFQEDVDSWVRRTYGMNGLTDS